MFDDKTTNRSDEIVRDYRSWWKDVYCAGIKAELSKQSRMPPDGLTDDQRDVWFAGYDR